MEDGRIANDQINASSFRSGHNPFNGRLHNRTNRGTGIWGAWCSDENDPNIYLQVRSYIYTDIVTDIYL
jgi:hypothetical protein